MKISELPPTEAITDEDLFTVVQDGENKRVKYADIFKNLPEPTDDTDAVTKGYVDSYVADNTLQETMYTFSFADLDGIKADNTPVLRRSIAKTSTLLKGGVQVSVPAIIYSITLFTGKADLSTGEITKLFDIPAKYNVSPATISIASVDNISDFTPYIILPAFKEGIFAFEYLLSSAENYCTNRSYRLLSNSNVSGNSKIMGFSLTATIEFASESIRDAFYNEFTPVLNGITHFCLKYEEHNMQTIESSYMGG